MKVTQVESRREEAVQEVTAWLQSIWRLMNQGRINTLRPVPTYDRRQLLPDDKVEEVALAIEGVFAFELENYPGWHQDAQQIKPNQHLVTPGFTGLEPLQKRALVEGVDRILQKYRVGAKAKAR
ncbi:hypothetical protein KBB41_02145 [Candidatus Curtissbacteria bacterium]|nr:hypothetical protein [Candidatus Curtissbacteria bacterium]